MFIINFIQMKKLFILPFFLFNYLFAQNIAENKIDEFTKERVIQVNCSKDTDWKTSDNILKGMFNFGYLSLTNFYNPEKNNSYLQFQINFGSSICFSENQSSIIFLFKNTDTLKLSYCGNTNCGQYILFKGKIDSNDIEKFINEDLYKIRIYTSNSYIDFEVKEKSIDRIKNTFILFKQTINIL